MIASVLLALRLQNIALLDSLELTFKEGFTVLTGETGAGKSILLDALDALFGGNQLITPNRLLRVGAKRGQIEASFLTNPSVEAWLDRQGFEIEFIERLPEFGFSTIANILASIKLAKYMKLGSDDAIITVATDGADLYLSELNNTKQDFKGIFDEVSCA